MEVKALEIEKINGYRRSTSGVFVPAREMVVKMLAEHKIPAEEKYPYLAQGREPELIERARKLQQAVLLVGPTGVGKSMLVKHIAKELDYPYLEFVCGPDATDGKLRGDSGMHLMPVEIDTKVETLNVRVLTPKPVSLAGLGGVSGQPVVLFIDELHKMRSNIETVLHPLTNERYVNMEDITGEVYRLHKDSLVVLALNPYYEGGIERVPTALRARLKTLEIPMVTDESKLFDIVLVNAPEAKDMEKQVKKLCRQTAAVCRAWQEITTSQNLYSSDRLVQVVGTELKKPEIAGNIIEAPSPRALVQAVRSMMGGEDLFDAIRHHLVNTIVRDFGVTANCLVNLYRTL